MASYNTYQLGDTVTVSALFRDTASALTDSVRPVFIIRNPAGATAQYIYGTDANVVKAAVGSYYATAFIPTGSASAAGRWTYWFGSDSALKQASQGFFVVEKNAIWTASNS